MEKVTYKLLKKLYKSEMLDINSINRLTGQKEKNRYNPYISYLMVEKMIVDCSEGSRPDGEGGFIDGVEYYRISIKGRDYIEEKRNDALMFWLPYGITTVIAVASLIVAIASLLR